MLCPGSSTGASNTTATRPRVRWNREDGMPRTWARPDVGRIRPSAHESVVVFPEPFGPSRPNSWPGSTRNDTPSRAVCSGYRLMSDSTSMLASAPWPALLRGLGSGAVSVLMEGRVWRLLGRDATAAGRCAGDPERSCGGGRLQPCRPRRPGPRWPGSPRRDWGACEPGAPRPRCRSRRGGGGAGGPARATPEGSLRGCARSRPRRGARGGRRTRSAASASPRCPPNVRRGGA